MTTPSSVGSSTTTGKVETAHVDLADGALVANGFIVDPIPNRANIDTGKERTLVVYNDGTDATGSTSSTREPSASGRHHRRRLRVVGDQPQR